MSKFIFILLLSISSVAAEKIRFVVKKITYTQIPMEQVMGSATKPGFTLAQVKEEESIVEIATDKISKAIEEVRKGVCKTLNNGSVKMWFKATAEGSFIVSTTTGEAGVEVQLECKGGK